MIKEALEYIVKLSKPETFSIGKQTYSDKELHRVSFNPKAEPIVMNTLSSLVDYMLCDHDKTDAKMFIHIVSPTEVRLFSTLDDERKRETPVIVKAKLPEFSFGMFMNKEEFCIGMQAKFIQNEDRDLLLKFAGTVETGTVAEYGDDGVTQKATIRQGVASKQTAIVPNPVCLIARRTFVEVPQPAGKYIFRMRQSNGGVTCALFEADGGAWMLEAKEAIRYYLDKELRAIPGLVLLS